MLKLGTAGLAVVVLPMSSARDVSAGLPKQICNTDMIVNREIYSRVQDMLDSFEYIADENPFLNKMAWSDCGMYVIDWREWIDADQRKLWMSRL